jgi:hypothetical protein
MRMRRKRSVETDEMCVESELDGFCHEETQTMSPQVIMEAEGCSMTEETLGLCCVSPGCLTEETCVVHCDLGDHLFHLNRGGSLVPCGPVSVV